MIKMGGVTELKMWSHPDSWIVEVEIGATTLEKGLLAFPKVKYKFLCSVSPEILLLGVFPGEVSAYIHQAVPRSVTAAPKMGATQVYIHRTIDRKTGAYSYSGTQHVAKGRNYMQ